MSLAWQAGLGQKKVKNEIHKSRWNNVKLVYKPTIRHYRRRNIRPSVNLKAITQKKSSLEMSSYGKSSILWNVNRENWGATSVSFSDMVDSTIKRENGVISVKEKNVLDEKEEFMPLLTGKKKWGMMFCVVFVAFIIIVPLLTVTLYNFISCYQASKVTNSNLGKAQRL